MNHIEENNDALAMALIHQLPQFIRRAVAARSSEEIGHLVAKGGIVDVLHDCHQLDTVVAQVDNPRQHLILEL